MPDDHHRNHRRPLPSRALAIALAAALAACGSSSSPSGQANAHAPEVNPAGDIPDTQAYVAYSPPGSAYSVKVPEGWARTAAPGGATSFTDKLNSVQMEARPATAPVSERQARLTLVPTLAKTIPGFRSATVSTVARAAGPAVRIAYLASSPVDPVTGRSHTDAVERYAFFHRGLNVVLTLSGPRGADNVDPWKIVTDSLRFTR